MILLKFYLLSFNGVSRAQLYCWTWARKSIATIVPWGKPSDFVTSQPGHLCLTSFVSATNSGRSWQEMSTLCSATYPWSCNMSWCMTDQYVSCRKQRQTWLTALCRWACTTLTDEINHAMSPPSASCRKLACREKWRMHEWWCLSLIYYPRLSLH